MAVNWAITYWSLLNYPVSVINWSRWFDLRFATGGSATNPEGDLVVRLFDGAIGPTQLAQAQANASLNAAQRLKFSMDLSPVEARAGGFARVTGSVPLASSGKLQGKTTIKI